MHADLRNVLRVHRGADRTRALRSILEDVASEAPGNLWMPTFNYGFCRGEEFRIAETRSESGVLSEFFRSQLAHWRTPVPIFSVAGQGPMPSVTVDDEIVLPFGPRSIFSSLVATGGYVLMVGCDLKFLNLAHYAEVADGAQVPYRYDKDFSGYIEFADGTHRNVVVRYHVTPLVRRVLYDWPAIAERMTNAGVLRELPKWGGGSLIEASGFVKEWQRLAEIDPFWPLLEPSRNWVEPMYQRLGRRFLQSDFEPADTEGRDMPQLPTGR